MKIFLDTADVTAIRAWVQTELVDGITTNPTNLSAAGETPVPVIQEICSIMADRPVSVEVTETEASAMYEQAKKIVQLAPNVVVKVPCHIRYMAVIKRLVQENVPLNITLVFSLTQALAMCKLGVQYISPFVGRWDDIGVDGTQILQDIRGMIDMYGFETQLLAASLRNVQHIHDAIVIGADVITVPPTLLELALKNPLTDQGIARFDADWKKLGIKQFP